MSNNNNAKLRETAEKENSGKQIKEYDLYRSRPLRYFGYSNELCKAVRALLPCGLGNIGSIVTLCYIFADTYDKSSKAAQQYIPNKTAKKINNNIQNNIQNNKNNMGDHKAKLAVNTRQPLKPFAINVENFFHKYLPENPTIQQTVGIAAGDALIWQSLASIIIPSFLLDRTRFFSCRLLQMSGCRKLIRTVPSLLSFALIPFIITPIDDLVDYVMNQTYRRWLDPNEDCS